jgi:hypothetical protein
MTQKLERMLQRNPALRHLREDAAATDTTSAGEARLGSP